MEVFQVLVHWWEKENYSSAANQLVGELSDNCVVFKCSSMKMRDLITNSVVILGPHQRGGRRDRGCVT
jgi:hypothetical protein